jgi:hypothetical protein
MHETLGVRTDDALTNERPDGMTRRPDGWQGTEFSDLQTAQNLLEALLNSESLLKSIITKK